LELLDVDKVSVKLDGEIVIHDPCYYSRYLNIIEEPRRILSKGGINIIEPTRTKRLSYCCGGPIESISPRIASTIARNRFDELKMFSKKLIVMCPICLSNLRNIADEECVVEDVSSYISKIYGVEK
jgi:Fe-S oxidoreductase